MKLYFTLTDGIKNDEKNLNLLKLCLKSAKENTSLNLNVLYDGNENDNVHQIFMQYGVNVIFTKLSFADKIEKYYRNWIFNDLQNSLTRMSGCFLKFDIALHEKEDDVVLYSDIDTFFAKDTDWDKFKSVKTLAAASEFNRDGFDDNSGYKYFSAGIMILNIPELKKRREELFYMLDNDIKPYQECWDQGFFNHLYKDDFEIMPFEFNWKPYWGTNQDAIIIHYHGWKIDQERSDDACDTCSYVLKRYEEALEGILYYTLIAYRFLGLDKDKEVADLGYFLTKLKLQTTTKQALKLSSNILYSIYKKTEKLTKIPFFNNINKYAKNKIIKRKLYTEIH